MKKIKRMLTNLNKVKYTILKTMVVLVSIFIVGGAFYWYQVRPAKIYKACNEKSRKHITENVKTFNSGEEMLKVNDFMYKSCLRSKGINK